MTQMKQGAIFGILVAVFIGVQLIHASNHCTCGNVFGSNPGYSANSSNTVGGSVQNSAASGTCSGNYISGGNNCTGACDSGETFCVSCCDCCCGNSANDFLGTTSDFDSTVTCPRNQTSTAAAAATTATSPQPGGD